MALKYPLVREFVIVIADLYVPAESSLDAADLQGLEQIARFGERTGISGGWRAWLARECGRPDLAAEPAACVAAHCVPDRPPGFACLATPLHLMTGLTSLHLEQGGLLRLSTKTLAALAEDFEKVFQGSGFKLLPLASGGFLLTAPAIAAGGTIEPARCVGTDLGEALPADVQLRRLSAEIELWLHEHADNEARIVAGEAPVNALWLWGAGACLPENGVHRGDDKATAMRAFGSDPYLDGLLCAGGGRAKSLPERFEAFFDEPAERVIVVTDLAHELNVAPRAGVGGALAALDARFIWPAAQAVHRGRVQRLRVVANDRCLSYRRRDRLRIWRPACRGLRGLQ